MLNVYGSAVAANDDVQSIITHRLDTTCEARVAWFRVQTTGAGHAWRHEVSLWEDKKTMVLDYWKSCTGGRDGQLGISPSDGPWLPSRILAERPRRKKEFLVEWVGYKAETWEPRRSLEEHHQHVIDRWVWELQQEEEGADGEEQETE
ncbi:hypothetical protein CONLIGDRAFT_686755 [Coniochaeta ligniaria NRRL 30616]|uniref:Chromo domain-containing protein n=1 Tax=Coniochaeta ligniaria NRRL 30616 TaxID=1408157 RepID=A0A1J7J2D5_9PEZI|nr:hypothetical protein CONLIGDRAFT_686755 [Coniochaeta ligniaria NRRL 30616]